MSQQCAVAKCNRALRGLCDCCQQHLCLQHLNEHNIALISQLNPVTDQINTLSHRLKSIDVQQIIDDCHQKLKQWRDDCHEKINRFVEQKCYEIDRFVNEKTSQQRETLVEIQSKMTELIHAQETTRQDIDTLTLAMQKLVTNMDTIEEICSTIHTRPLLLSDDTILLTKGIGKSEVDLRSLSPVCQAIPRPDGSYASLASNDRYLLIHQVPHLCLVDREMNIVKQISWSRNAIYDMCWSSALNRFIILEENDILLVDENTVTIDALQTIERDVWFSCTCSSTSLFLSTGRRAASIIEYNLLPSITLAREWGHPHTCTQDEVIAGIAYNNEKLALTIMNESEKSLRIELRDAETLDRTWVLQFDTAFDQNVAYRCCSLACNEWLLSDYDNRYLLHITEKGKIKTMIPYDPIPYRANLFGDMLVVSIKGGINFHKL